LALQQVMIVMMDLFLMAMSPGTACRVGIGQERLLSADQEVSLHFLHNVI